MITPQTRSKMANWYQQSIANKAGDTLYDSAAEPGMLGEVPKADQVAQPVGMLGDAPTPAMAQAATQASPQPTAVTPPADRFGGKANLNAQGNAMSFAESLAHTGDQQAYDDSQSAMWNQLNGRWRRKGEALTGAIQPQQQGGSNFQTQLQSTGMLEAPAPTATTPPASTTAATTTPAGTTPAANTAATATTPTPSANPNNTAPTTPLIDAIKQFQSETGLLKDQTPEAIAANLSKVTAAEFNSMSPDQQAKARELFRLAGVPVPAGATPTTPTTPTGNGPSTLNRDDLTRRNINEATETAQGRLAGMLDSPLAEAARQRAYMAANDRGMLNSTMAVQAGEQAAMDAVSRIAESDAAAVRGAGDYNTALDNQAQMYNTDQQNAYLLQQMGIQADAATQGRSILAQMDIAKLNDATARYNAERNDATSRYNTDSNYRDSQERARMSLANNIIVSNDIPPARRAEMLRALGFPDLANAIYVVTDVGEDLGGGGGGGNDMPDAQSA